MLIVAVAFTDGNVTISAERPKRHCDIIREFGKELHEWEQGFLTDAGNFVDRKEAKRIAIEANQVLIDRTLHDELFSENLW